MENVSKQYIIYNILKIQIQFGTYRYGEHLPRLEDTCELLSVSIYTVRCAYCRLQREGYIKLTKKGGSKIKVNYSEQEIEQHIQSYFAPRKEMFLDAVKFMPQLLRNLQLTACKNLSDETLDKLDALVKSDQVHISYIILLYTELVYDSLGNDLLSHLMKNIIITFLFPFYNLQDWNSYLYMEADIVSSHVRLCREKRWDELYIIWNSQLEQYLDAIKNFYNYRITIPIPENQIPFTWDINRDSTQICCSLGLRFCQMIVRNHYPVGSFLPSIEKLAAENKVSVSTIRRTLGLLNCAGITQSINGVGTKVLKINQIEENCKWTDEKVQKYLLEYAFSMQILTLSCRNIAKVTVDSLNHDEVSEYIKNLETFKSLNRLDLITSFSFRFLADYAPSSFIRTVYTKLYNQSFWGYPLQSKMENQELINIGYLKHYDKIIRCLECSDALGFADNLEELLYSRMSRVSRVLVNVGITDAKHLLDFSNQENNRIES